MTLPELIRLADPLALLAGILFWIVCGSYAVGSYLRRVEYPFIEIVPIFLGGPITVLLQIFYRIGRGKKLKP